MRRLSTWRFPHFPPPNAAALHPPFVFCSRCPTNCSRRCARLAPSRVRALLFCPWLARMRAAGIARMRAAGIALLLSTAGSSSACSLARKPLHRACAQDHPRPASTTHLCSPSLRVQDGRDVLVGHRRRARLRRPGGTGHVCRAQRRHSPRAPPARRHQEGGQGSSALPVDRQGWELARSGIMRCLCNLAEVNTCAPCSPTFAAAWQIKTHKSLLTNALQHLPPQEYFQGIGGVVGALLAWTGNNPRLLCWRPLPRRRLACYAPQPHLLPLGCRPH